MSVSTLLFRVENRNILSWQKICISWIFEKQFSFLKITDIGYAKYTNHNSSPSFWTQKELFLSRHFLSFRRDSASKQIVLWFILKTEASRVYPTSKKSCKSFGAIWVQKWGLWELLLFLHIVVVVLGANGGLKPEVIWGFPDLTSRSHFEQS